MSNPNDVAARLTLKIAGEFQTIRDIWVRRLDDYFAQLESLVEGQWLDTEDIKGVIHESRLAAREALDGFGSELSARLVHASNGLFARFEAERQMLTNEIQNLRTSLSEILSGDDNSLKRENHKLRTAILKIPEFKLLRFIQSEGRVNYKELARISGIKISHVKRLVKSLASMGYVTVDKKSRPHSVVFLTAPWGSEHRPAFDTEANGPILTLLQDPPIEHP